MKHVFGWMAIGVLTVSMTAFGQGRGRGGACGQGQGQGCVCPNGSAGQTGAAAPVASNPIVQIKGKILKTQIAAGQGMPYLEVDQNGRTVKVLLGSMRYLLQQNFNPKAGDEVSVKGYQTADEVVAITVTPTGGSELKLRDDSGWPVWGGRGRMGRCGGCGKD